MLQTDCSEISLANQDLFEEHFNVSICDGVVLEIYGLVGYVTTLCERDSQFKPF